MIDLPDNEPADHSRLSEQKALGAIIAFPEKFAPIAAAAISPEDFGEPHNRTIFGAVMELFDAGRGIDIVSVYEALRAAGVDDLAASSPVADAASFATDSEHLFREHIGTMQRKRQMRALGKLGREAVAASEDATQDPAEALERLQAGTLLAMRQDAGGSRSLAAVIESMDADNAPPPLMVPTGIAAFDRLLGGGLHGGTLTVIGARPSVGKSALAMGWALHAAASGYRAAFFSLEMQAAELARRAIQSMTGIAIARQHRRDLTDRESALLARSKEALRKLPLDICDCPGLTLGQLRARVIRAVSEGAKIVVVDYLQLMRGNPKADRRTVIEANVEGAKELALEFGIPVVLPSQLNRESDREKREPRLSDLRETGAIEQSADVAPLLHRERDEGGGYCDFAKLIVAKHRNGPQACLDLQFIPQRCIFDDGEPKPRQQKPSIAAAAAVPF